MAEEIEDAVRTIGSALARAAQDFHAEVRVRNEGTVTSAVDGVLRISGLPDAAAEEVLELGHSGQALALSLDEDGVYAVALGDANTIREGHTVRTTGSPATIPVGLTLQGRILDPLGRPLDGVPLPSGLTHRPLEQRAPHIHERSEVRSPLYTGTLALDAMFPVGRGQRELILGDEGTGKTSLAVDAILRQKETGVVSVYVAIGQRRSEVWQLVETLRQSAGQWIVVAAFEDDSPGLRYLTPFAAMTIAEYFMQRGEHALVVFDDLSAHAVAWRELSLLLRRPPGREAYPGDIFYLHARLLERATQMSTENGGGSLTALPLATLEGGRLTSYIPTNLISITDGQIVLSQELFAAGQRPAIDAGLSVSRVGSKAQPQALRELAGRLRLEYAAFLELETFARLGTRLEEGTRRRIEIGRRIRRLLRAGRRAPLGIAEEVLRLSLADETEHLLRIPEGEIELVTTDLVKAFRTTHPDMFASLERDAVLSDTLRKRFQELIGKLISSRYPAENPP